MPHDIVPLHIAIAIDSKDPPHVLGGSKNKYRIIACFLRADLVEKNLLELDLNWMFDYVKLPDAGWLKAGEFQFATRGGELILEIIDGTLQMCSPGLTVPTTYKIKKNKKRRTSLDISPSVKGKVLEVEIETSGYHHHEEQGEDVEYITEITTNEQPLRVLNDELANSCKWSLISPDVDSIGRTYVFGNIFVTARVRPNHRGVSGRITTSPNGVQIYNEGGKYVDTVPSFGMLYQLWKEYGVSYFGSLANPRHFEFTVRLE